jgi:hypothetical protein
LTRRGADTAELLHELGYGDDEIGRLEASGIVKTAAQPADASAISRKTTVKGEA